jgi:hypothetical protein
MLCVWGLAVSRDWPLDVSQSLTPEKREFAAAPRDMCRARGLKLLAGLGVYSLGSDLIIEAYPHRARTNPHALCPHEPQSWEWMARVVDFVLTELPVDGVQMQSADHNRCRCTDCAKWSDLEHHAHLNTRVANYIHANFVGKTVGVNSWGMSFGDAAVVTSASPALREMSRSIDYFTEVENALGRAGGESRREVINALQCDFGTLGGPQVEPPQHWERDRWFLPVVRWRCEHLRALAQDGGCSCEFFFHIDANPGDELTLWVTGYALQDPAGDWQDHLRRAVERIYEPETAAATQALCDVFARAEAAYYDRVHDLTERTFSLKPLVYDGHNGCDTPGPPIYLNALGATARAAYVRELEALLPLVDLLSTQVGTSGKLQRIASCLRNAIIYSNAVPCAGLFKYHPETEHSWPTTKMILGVLRHCG